MTSSDDHGEQLSLLRGQVRPARVPDATALAPLRPVARVAVDTPLAHLDRPFDYAVAADQHDDAVPGCRVTVRFAGKRVGGYVLERVDRGEHEGRLEVLQRVVSPEVVLPADSVRLVRAVADRYAGTFADVVRLAVPPRHASTEKRERRPLAPEPLGPADPTAWSAYTDGPAFLTALRSGRSPRAAWSALPGDWPAEVASAVHAAVASGRGAVVCVPDAADLARVDTAVRAVLGRDRHVTLSADVGTAARYAAFLTAARGQVPVVLGTRAAAFAPVSDLGLVVVWDDGDDLHAEPRAPYPHVREVLLERARQHDAAVLVGGLARTAEAQRLVETGHCRDVVPDLAARRSGWPVVAAAGADEVALERDPSGGRVRFPREAGVLMGSALEQGPVLVQVPRTGYRGAIACGRCRGEVRCRHCHGPVAQRSGTAEPACRWCGRGVQPFRCAHCGHDRLRAGVLGADRTVEELGRAFPRVPVRRSSGERVLSEVGPEPAIVVATPGAEPVADGGFAAAVLLDGWLLLSRPDLRAAEEALRRWLRAAALVRPGTDGRVLVVADPTHESVQALVRVDPVGAARRQLRERADTRLPPASRLVTVEGPSDELEPLVDGHAWPDGCEVLGPVPIEPEPTGPPGATPVERGRLVVRSPWSLGPALVRAARDLQGLRSARKQPHLRVRVDPAVLG